MKKGYLNSGKLYIPNGTKTVRQRVRHASISNKARTIVMVNKARVMQGRTKKERKPIVVYIALDVAKDTLDITDSGSPRYTPVFQ